MRKVILIVLTVISTQAFGQSFLERFHFGIKAGTNYSDFIDTDFDTKGLTGFHGGVIVAFDISDRWAIQEDFMFSIQGTKLKNDLFEEDVKISYLNVPIVLQYHSKMGLYIEAGPQFNMLIDDYDGLDDEDFAEKIDVGAVGGIGYHFNKDGGLKGFGIGARYYIGLTKVSEFNFSNFDNADYKQGVVQVSLFYIF
ncbi:MAG: PorT family protein [Labilibaculum sp.]|nr:PorT family protein [Labilibaculum sp.]